MSKKLVKVRKLQFLTFVKQIVNQNDKSCLKRCIALIVNVKNAKESIMMTSEMDYCVNVEDFGFNQLKNAKNVILKFQRNNKTKLMKGTKKLKN